MKINAIIPRVSFGYDKKFSKQLASNLLDKKTNQDAAKAIIQLDTVTNEIEDKLVFMEKNSPEDVESNAYNMLVTMLIDLKETIANYMYELFPSEKFADKQIEQYEKEISENNGKNLLDWRKAVCADLSDYSSEHDNKETENNIYMHSNSQEDELDEFEQTILNKSDASQAESLVHKFTPTASSPVGFKSVVGLDSLKNHLKENIIDIINNPEQEKLDFEEYGTIRPRGYLLYGPPGCGKTYIAQALALETGLSMYQMDVSKIGSMYINKTSNNIELAFDFLEKEAKKQNKPVILFMDEVDSLAMSRDHSQNSDETLKTVASLLKLVEGAKDRNIIVIGATNKYDLLDDAFKARFDGQFYVPLPDTESISNLLKLKLSERKKGIKLANSENDIKKLSQHLRGFSNRSIMFIVNEACKLAKNDGRRDVEYNDVEKIIQTTELQKVNEKNYMKQDKVKRRMGFN